MRKFKLIKKYPGFNELGLIITIDSEQETGYYSENKEFWEKIIEKQPLFKTEDGVDIFEKDNYYVVYFEEGNRLPLPRGAKLFGIDGPYIAEPLKEGEFWSKNAKMFSTKEKAEEYVLLNKPCLSVKDVLRIGITKPYQEYKTFIEQLKYLAKTNCND
jgi:hypothetical protein